jgi:hypothetical protein
MARSKVVDFTDPARPRNVTDALLKRVELDIAALEKAYRS